MTIISNLHILPIVKLNSLGTKTTESGKKIKPFNSYSINPQKKGDKHIQRLKYSLFISAARKTGELCVKERN